MNGNQIKMADVFELPVTTHAGGELHCGLFLSFVQFDSTKDANYAAHAINSYDRLTAENEALREEVELLKEYTKQLQRNDAEVIDQFVSGIINCIKAISPEVSQHKNTLCIRELKSFRDSAKEYGVCSIQGTANKLRQQRVDQEDW